MAGRVLVVDDSKTQRLIMVRALAEFGCEVVGEAEDGQQAIEMAASLSPTPERRRLFRDIQALQQGGFGKDGAKHPRWLGWFIMTDMAKADQPRVLILDDERDMCGFVADVGDDQGFNAQWCDNFEDFACRYSIDLRGIFLDLAMPGVDGVEIIRFLGDNNAKAHLVLMSGHDIHLLEAARRLAESRGLKVAGVLHKPFELSALIGMYDQLATIAAPQRPATAIKQDGRYVPTASDLDAALVAGHIIPFYQPKFSVSTRTITGVEVLARWRHPDHGLVVKSQEVAHSI